MPFAGAVSHETRQFIHMKVCWVGHATRVPSLPCHPVVLWGRDTLLTERYTGTVTWHAACQCCTYRCHCWGLTGHTPLVVQPPTFCTNRKHLTCTQVPPDGARTLTLCLCILRQVDTYHVIIWKSKDTPFTPGGE